MKEPMRISEGIIYLECLLPEALGEVKMCRKQGTLTCPHAYLPSVSRSPANSHKAHKALPSRWFSSPVPDIWMTHSCSELSLPEFARCWMRKCDSAGCALKYLVCYSVVCTGYSAKMLHIQTNIYTTNPLIIYEICCSKLDRIFIFGWLFL